MTFDYYKPFYSSQQQRLCPGVTAHQLDEATFDSLVDDEHVSELVAAYQAGDTQAKAKLPAVCWTGRTLTGKRKAADMKPTQYIICDIDHLKVKPFKAWEHILEHKRDGYDYKIRLVHVTPSGNGLRLVVKATQPFPTIIEHMEWLDSELHLSELGDYDTCVKDVSRLSFLVPRSYIIYYDQQLFMDDDTFAPIKAEPQPAQTSRKTDVDYDAIREKYSEIEFRGHKVRDIAMKYVSVMGEPQEGERHNFYNLLVKNFRHICENNPRKVFAVLPRYTDDDAMCLSQCQSICKSNTMSALPKDFYFFLKDNGYYEKQLVSDSEVEEYMMDEPTEEKEKLPKMPPIFRELLGMAPPDFVFPAMQALLPIMGTLTSHLRTEYWLDQREHSTQFFSVIYAGSGMGKGFVERYIDLLTSDLQLRDLLCSERENLYNRIVNKNKKNDKDPDNPRVTLRIIEPKCSEADFLEKQQANKGHHMFTYAAEMDQWRKGVRAAGGNKDDMLRIAWDNGFYGQNFKSTNTFKGRIRLYWNVLITGTKPQLDLYFKNVENGLVGRCGFAEVKNQEFAEAAIWKKLSDNQLKTIKKWLARMDAANYKEPLDPDYANMIQTVSDEEFDNEIPWRYEWQPLVFVDMTWLRPTIDKFLKRQLKQSALDRDNARDSFRRRTAVRGLRLGLLCTALYTNLNNTTKKIIADFVSWFMEHDLNETLGLWQRQYNEVYNDSPTKVTQKGVYETVGEVFTKVDVFTACKKCMIKTPISKVISDWMRLGAIEKISIDQYKKTKK
ncbi:MAG: BT4734/BF3469 family protein [Bacteroidales bacterium]|nr:BT4734/BF3469 family protein [Bacteroidales bacterium]